MTHPQYRIKAVNIKNGVRTEEIVSKQLMFKCDAQRVVDCRNRSEAVFNDDKNAFYYYIEKYEKKLA